MSCALLGLFCEKLNMPGRACVAFPETEDVFIVLQKHLESFRLGHRTIRKEWFADCPPARNSGIFSFPLELDGVYKSCEVFVTNPSFSSISLDCSDTLLTFFHIKSLVSDAEYEVLRNDNYYSGHNSHDILN